MPHARVSKPVLQFFSGIIVELDAVVAERSHDVDALLAGARGLMARLLAHEPFLRECCSGERFLEEHPELATETFRYSLFQAPDGAFAVLAGGFAPGAATSVHDHKSWGLVGVWKGEEREERFERVDGGEQPGLARLRPIGEVVNAPGAISLIVPGTNEIHRIKNVTTKFAYSIHIYGRARAPIDAFDLETGQTSPAPESFQAGGR